MLLRNHPNRIHIVFDDHRLVANAGLCQYVVVQRFRPLKSLSQKYWSGRISLSGQHPSTKGCW